MARIMRTGVKRKRSTSKDPDPSPKEVDPPPTKSPEIYFDDGNIVLLAENVAFRVYKGLLTHHSTVFRDMFSIYGQSNNKETFEGCPVVRLSDESRDVAKMLPALIYNTYAWEMQPGLVNLRFYDEYCKEVSQMLRIANKYLVDPLRKRCTKTLRQFYPDTLPRWDALARDHIVTNPEEVVQLLDADILLPAAFYCLCLQGASEIFDKQSPISPHVLRRYCERKEDISHNLITFLNHHILRKPQPRCENSTECCHAWDALEKRALQYLTSPWTARRLDPLFYLGELLKAKYVLDLCGGCRKEMEETIQKERLKIWESLPRLFGLGSWEELRERYPEQ